MVHYNNTLHTVGYDILQQTVWYNTGTILYISMFFSHIIGYLYAFYYWITLTGDKEHLKMIQWAVKVRLISQFILNMCLKQYATTSLFSVLLISTIIWHSQKSHMAYH